MTVAGVVAALAAEAHALGKRRALDTGRPVGTSERADDEGRGDARAVADPALTRLVDGTLVAVGGMGAEAARSAALRLLEAGAGALVSWGLAGGLDPALAAGTLVLPTEVIDAQGVRLATTASWREALAGGARQRFPLAAGAMLTAPVALTSCDAKLAAHRATGAVAVDMESSAIARTATAAGVPFVVLRAIVDTVRDPVPACVVAAGDSGAVELGPLLAGLLRAPGEVVALIRLAYRYRAAMRTLKGVAGLLSPTLESITTVGLRPA